MLSFLSNDIRISARTAAPNCRLSQRQMKNPDIYEERTRLVRDAFLEGLTLDALVRLMKSRSTQSPGSPHFTLRVLIVIIRTSCTLTGWQSDSLSCLKTSQSRVSQNATPISTRLSLSWMVLYASKYSRKVGGTPVT